MGAPQLVLFDIDGTLMRGTGPHHGDVLVEAVEDVLQLQTSLDGIPVHGMLDGEIVRVMCRRAGLAEEIGEEAHAAIATRAQELFLPRCPDLRAKVLPGVRELLGELRAARVPMGLVTGNFSAIGWRKIEAANLRDYFSFGAFAEMGRTRTELARLAQRMSGFFSSAGITLIGDAPSDIEAARANGFRSVAVATGLTPIEELAALGPDLLFHDLSRHEDRRRITC